MLISAVARRYANAFFKLAKERNEVLNWLNGLVELDNVLKGSAELKEALNSPTVATVIKHRIAKQLFGKVLDEGVLSLLHVLLNKNRQGYVGMILDEYKALIREDSGIVYGVITTAVPMSEDAKGKLIKSLEKHYGKRLEPKYEIDPKLLGGFVIRVGDNVIDTSLNRQIRELREKIKMVEVL